MVLALDYLSSVKTLGNYIASTKTQIGGSFHRHTAIPPAETRGLKGSGIRTYDVSSGDPILLTFLEGHIYRFDDQAYYIPLTSISAAWQTDQASGETFTASGGATGTLLEDFVTGDDFVVARITSGTIGSGETLTLDSNGSATADTTAVASQGGDPGSEGEYYSVAFMSDFASGYTLYSVIGPSTVTTNGKTHVCVFVGYKLTADLDPTYLSGIVYSPEDNSYQEIARQTVLTGNQTILYSAPLRRPGSIYFYGSPSATNVAQLVTFVPSTMTLSVVNAAVSNGMSSQTPLAAQVLNGLPTFAYAQTSSPYSFVVATDNGGTLSFLNVRTPINNYSYRIKTGLNLSFELDGAIYLVAPLAATIFDTAKASINRILVDGNGSVMSDTLQSYDDFTNDTTPVSFQNVSVSGADYATFVAKDTSDPDNPSVMFGMCSDFNASTFQVFRKRPAEQLALTYTFDGTDTVACSGDPSTELSVGSWFGIARKGPRFRVTALGANSVTISDITSASPNLTIPTGSGVGYLETQLEFVGSLLASSFGEGIANNGQGGEDTNFVLGQAFSATVSAASTFGGREYGIRLFAPVATQDVELSYRKVEDPTYQNATLSNPSSGTVVGNQVQGMTSDGTLQTVTWRFFLDTDNDGNNLSNGEVAESFLSTSTP